MRYLKPFTITRMISLLYRYGQIYISNQLKACSFAAGDHPVILVISENPGITQDCVSKLLLIDKGTTARIVKRLEKTKYVTRESDKEDKRFNHLYPTEIAMEAALEIRKVLDEWYLKLTENITPDETEMCFDLMSKLHDNAVKYAKCDHKSKCCDK